MYFTSAMPGPTQTADESPCVDFAKEIIPVLQKALSSDPESASREAA